MTTGATAVLIDVVTLGIWVAVMAGTWAALRKKRYILLLPGLLLGAAGLFLIVRGGEKLVMLAQLWRLRVDEVRSVRFGDRLLEDKETVNVLAAALRAVTWATTEHSCQARAVPVTLTLYTGAVRQVWLASNPCSKGLAVNVSDLSSGGLYHGALFSPISSDALAAHGLALPSR